MRKKIGKIVSHLVVFGALILAISLMVWFFYMGYRIDKNKEICFKTCPNTKYEQVGNLKFPANYKYMTEHNGIVKCMCFPNYKIIEVKNGH
jgi:hypothetical protein